MKTFTLISAFFTGFFFLFCGTQVGALDENSVDPTAQSFICTISITDAPNAVKAFLFDVHYPTDLLTYQSTEKNDLLEEDFILFVTNEYSPGKVRIVAGAPLSDGIAKGAVGKVVTLNFVSKTGQKKINPTFKLDHFRAHMRGWSYAMGDKKQKADLLIHFEKK